MKNEQTQQANLNNSNERRSRSKAKPIPKLTLNACTWQKQSHGLYDYQSPPDKIFKEELEIQQSSRVFRNSATRKTTIRQMKSQSKQLPDRVEIFNVDYTPSQKCYMLKNSLSTQLNDVLLSKPEEIQAIVDKHKLFISLAPGGESHQLAVGDFIKLGRVELAVLEINNSKKTESLDFAEIYGAKQYIFHLEGELEGCCKVCLSDEATEKDPLVNPCNCKGSCGVIHLGCLKNWINNKVKKECFLKVRTYNFEKFSCEICQAPFPTMIRLDNGDEVFLLNFQRPTSPYILLEQCAQTEAKHGKTLHFIFSEADSRVNIGRGQNCQLNISDISVSRLHSYIVFKNDHFCIHDTNSKFGTLVELKKDLKVKKSVRLQHNGCFISIEPKVQKKEKASKSAKKSVPKKSEE